MKKILSTLIIASSLFGAHYKYEISPMLGYNIAEGNINLDNYMVYGAEMQFNDLALSIFKPEISLFYGKAEYNEPALLDGENSDVLRAAINGVYEYKPVYNGTLIPFAKVGIGYENLDTYSSNNHNSIYADVAGGVKLLLTKRWALKAEALYMLKNNSARYDNNFDLLVGLTYSFGDTQSRSYVSQNEESKKQTDEAITVATTASNQDVSADDDNDGVLNSMDKCPNTPEGVKVQSNGCEIDTDADGVVDSKDMCKSTPAGAKVDASGCELDDDHDGVVNSSDKCPTTPQGAKVDADGCELDSDGDGVVDSRDLCPNTPQNLKVDENGCPEIQNLHINFKLGSYEVDEASKGNIEKFATFLKAAPMYSVKIVGHTDNIGNAKKNEKLSLKRAQSVKQILVDFGVDPARITTEGKGETNPIASNKTKEGRAKNRRIEAELIK